MLLADPPWLWTGGQSRGPALHYPMLSTDALCDLPIGALGADHSALALWSTGAHLDHALRVMAAWGYAYRALGWVWVRQGTNGRSWMGMGRWTRTGTELCLLGTRGRPRRRPKATAVRQVIRAPAPPDGGAWGAKPPEIYARIEALLEGPYIELFGRGEARPGWDIWGLEADIPPPGDGPPDVLTEEQGEWVRRATGWSDAAAARWRHLAAAGASDTELRIVIVREMGGPHGEGGCGVTGLRHVHCRARDLAIWVSEPGEVHRPDRPAWSGAATVAAVRAAWGVPAPGDVR